LQDRSVSGAVALEQYSVQSQRLPERSDGLLEFLVLKVGIGQIAVEDGHVIPDGNGLVVRLDGFAVFFPLVIDRADIVCSVGISRDTFDGAVVNLQLWSSRRLLMRGKSRFAY